MRPFWPGTAFLLLAGTFLLSSCGEWRPSFGQITNQAPVGMPDAVVHNFKTDFVALNFKKWELLSTEAKVFTKENRFYLSNIFMESYSQTKEVVNRVQSGYGILYNDSKNVELSNNVTIMSSNGTTITGNYFFWDNATERFTSPYYVKVVKGNGDTVAGIGFVADRRLDKYTFKQNVGGVIRSMKSLN